MRHFVQFRLPDGRAFGVAVDLIEDVLELTLQDKKDYDVGGCVGVRITGYSSTTFVLGKLESVLAAIAAAQQ